MCKRSVEDWKDFIGKVHTSLGESLKQVIATADDLGVEDTGGYFSLEIYNDDGNFLLPPSLAGEVTNGKDYELVDSSHEKSMRVKYYEHASSWQTRNPEDKQRGGAIFFCHDDCSFIFCFSGLTEHCDEAISLLTAMKVGCLTNDEAIHIATISGNTVFLRCLTEIKEPTSQEVSDNSEHQQLDDEWWGGR